MEKGEENKPIKFDLEERVICFALSCLSVAETIQKSNIGLHIGGQLIRSGTSPAFNYGEAQVAESRDDFIHKMKICLKELNETKIALILVIRKPLTNNLTLAEETLKECKELIPIFAKSIATAKKNKIVVKK